MERRPELTIIAGPDGAGKSRLCPFYVSAPSFDGNSVMRVTLRAQTGGHDVADDVIRFNYSEGLAKVKQHMHLFENLTFIDGNTEYGEIVALHNTKGNIHKVEDNPPQWFKEQFEEEFAKLERK